MEAKFEHPRLQVQNEHLKQTVQFIPIKSATDERMETEISEDRLLVLDNQEEERLDAIEILFRVDPRLHRIAGISLNIGNAPKCEIFKGTHREYNSVVSGLRQDDMPEMDVYKYDISFAKHPSTVIFLKFIAADDAVLIFGVDVYICPPAAGEAIPTQSINLQNVEDMVSNLNLSPGAEKCKEFLKVAMNQPREEDPLPMAINSLPPGLLQVFDQKMQDMESRLLSQIDLRFKALELNQERHFQQIMERLESCSNATVPSSSSKM